MVANYLTVLIATALVTAIGEDTAHQSQKNGVRVFLGFVVLIALISPLPSLFGELSEDLSELLSFSDVELNEGVFEGACEEAFCEGVGLAVADKFGTAPEDIRVSCRGFESAHMRAEHITVSLSGGGALLDFGAVRRYVCENFAGGCTVEVNL